MGCAQSSKVAAPKAPTLLTNKSTDAQGCKLRASTTGTAAPQTSSMIVDLDTPDLLGSFLRPAPNTRAPASSSVEAWPATTNQLPSNFESITSWTESPEQSAQMPWAESFNTTYTANSEFSFGPKVGSTRSGRHVGSHNLSGNLYALREETQSSAEPPAGKDDERGPFSELPEGAVAETVERTVHALVDAGEEAWSQVKATWNSGRCMQCV